MISIIRLVVYGFTGMACWYGGMQTAQHFNPLAKRAAMIWWIMGVLMVAIGISRAMELDLGLTDSIRDASMGHGWYAKRHPMQVWALMISGISSVVIAASLFAILGSYIKMMAAPILGTAMLTVMEIGRLVSMHETDTLFGLGIGGVQLNWGVQLASIAAVVYGVVLSREGDSVPQFDVKPRVEPGSDEPRA